MQTELAARIKEIDAQRVAAGLVLIISENGKDVSRVPCRDEVQRDYKMLQAKLLGRTFRIEGAA
jgi:hypothetical protein